MTAPEKQLIMNYIIRGENIGKTDVFDAVEILMQMNGEDLIQSVIENKGILRPIITGEIPQFSNELDVNNVLRVLVDSGLEDLTYEQIGSYLCPEGTAFEARRKYGETHYKFACQLGFAEKKRPFAATEIGIAYYLLENVERRQTLMNRLIFSVPFVQHAIVKASEGPYFMPDFLGEFLSPSTVKRRRSNMHKIMSWAYEITDGKHKQIFDNISWY